MKSEEIARIAGVSRSTVSRVINNYPNVPEATKKKVLKVIEEYNYVPNSYARTLAGKKSNTIGLFFVVPEDKVSMERIFKNEYFTSYLELLVDMANSKNYYVLVSLVFDKSEYAKIHRAFMEKRIDGGIVIGTRDDTLKQISVSNISAPLILFDYDLNKEERLQYKNANISLINSKDNEGIEKAVSYLYNLGHRKIGFIRGILNSRSGRIRLEAYKNAMARYNLPIDENYIIDGQFQIGESYNNMKKAISNGQLATAYVSSNDLMALGAITALKEEGIDVPSDISVIGFDNTHRAYESDPRLTTFGPNYKAMAKKAIDILDAKINGDSEVPSLVEYGVDFYERASCAKVKQS